MAVLRPLSAIHTEQNDEWLVGRRYVSDASMRKVVGPAEEVTPALETPVA